MVMVGFSISALDDLFWSSVFNDNGAWIRRCRRLHTQTEGSVGGGWDILRYFDGYSSRESSTSEFLYLSGEDIGNGK